ncbi:helix-turn-helix transcriptional regulator [Acidithiobacillus sp. IBUN Pt1247-S3]|uniref:helix-turn-helix transcriptional regulator n=1 Tax=Acidithiobacillus sp. IBUN Pt1247-S3 TaxID=3166642 RepID=UPI0034E453D5
MADTFLRRSKIIELLSEKAGRKISVLEIQKRLKSAGIEATVRTLQRDFIALSADGRIRADGKKPQGWLWVANESWPDALRPNLHTALALYLTREQLSRLLPASSLASLSPLMTAAERVLEEANNPGSLGSWMQRIVVLPWGPPMQPPVIDQTIHEAVTAAVLEGRQLQISYLKLGAKRAENRRVNPLGLIYREQVLYLVALPAANTDDFVWGGEEEDGDLEGAEGPQSDIEVDWDDIRILALHRIRDAKILDVSRIDPPGFNLQAYSRFAFSDEGSDEILLQFRIKISVGLHLEETPLSHDQIIKKGRTWMTVTATVQDNWQLRWWLQSFGSTIEVIAPRFLRLEFVDMAKDLGGYYLRGR